MVHVDLKNFERYTLRRWKKLWSIKSVIFNPTLWNELHMRHGKIASDKHLTCIILSLKERWEMNTSTLHSDYP